MDEILVMHNDKIIDKVSDKVNKKKKYIFTSDYTSKEYVPYKNDKHTVQSITKSILSLLVGIAIHNKDIKMSVLNEFIYKYFDDYVLDRRIKVVHLLTMTSGIDWNTDYDDKHNNTMAMEKSDDWIKYVLSRKMADVPGKVFHYKDCDTVLLGHVFEKCIKMPIDKYAKINLWKKLKISDYWNKVNGKVDVEGGLYLSSKSLLKIGTLILNKGVYENKRLLSLKYYDMMITNQVTNKHFGYGLSWWLHGDVVFGWGYKGQFIVIDTKNKAVGVLFQWNNKKMMQPYDFIQYIQKKIA